MTQFIVFLTYRVFSHDVTVAIFVFLNNEMVATLVFQTNLVGVELFYFYVKSFLLPQICIDAGHVSENSLYSWSYLQNPVTVIDKALHV